VKTFIAVVVVLGVVAAGAGGAVAGSRLAQATTRPAHEQVFVYAPELSAGARAGALTSRGGFTGFGGAPALKGDVTRTLAITAVDTGTGRLMLADAGSDVTIRFTSRERLFRLEPLDGSLQAGDVVVVRIEQGRVAGIMRVPPDLDAGVGTSETLRQSGLPSER
jgi:hypothetical protein